MGVRTNQAWDIWLGLKLCYYTFPMRLELCTSQLAWAPWPHKADMAESQLGSRGLADP
jgi:hypothetical protein